MSSSMQPEQTIEYRPGAGQGTIPDAPRPIGPAPDSPPGYELLRELGRGGMGVVYLARQKTLSREVALKMILAGGYSSETERQRFLSEAESVAAVSHPGIVQVFELGTHQELPFIALEFCPGGSLAQKLAGTPMAAKDAAKLIEQLARAMQTAHAKGIIHRDLKPANVLFGTDGAPKITDFGLARRTDSHSNLTQSGAIMGTPGYMAPEQAEGRAEAFGPATDVYSLGAILYECLTGRPPFIAATAVETIRQVAHDDPLPPGKLAPGIPRDLETICLKTLAKDTRGRYANAGELADDLGRFRAGDTIIARPASAFEKAIKQAKRRPALTAGILTAVLALLGITAVVAGANRKLQRERDAVAAEKLLAQKERETAERRLNLAVDSVENLVNKLGDDRLNASPELQQVKRDVLEEAIHVYGHLLEEDSKDPKIRRQGARAHFRIGLAYLLLGDLAKAAESEDKALAMQRSLIAEFPADPDYRLELSKSLAIRGHAANLTGDFGSGRKYYQESVDVGEALVKEHPDNESYRLALIDSLGVLGQFHLLERSDANPYYQRMLEQAEILNKAPKPAYGARLALITGKLHLAMKDVTGPGAAKAQEDIRKALDALPALAKEKPPTAILADTMSTLQGQVSQVKSIVAFRTGKAAEGLKQLEEGEAHIRERLKGNERKFPMRSQLLSLELLKWQALNNTPGMEANAATALTELLRTGDEFQRDFPAMTWVNELLLLPRSADIVLRVQKDPETDHSAAFAALEKDAAASRVKANAMNATYNLACAYSWLSVKDPAAAGKAMQLLSSLRKDGYFSPSNVKHLDVDPDLNPLRDQPIFKDFRKSLEIPPQK